MSGIKDFICDVEELYVAGMDVDAIAKRLKQPVSEVTNALKYISEQYDDQEYDVSESQEWYDYDPDC